MQYWIECPCGKQVTVRSSQSGSQIVCSCGLCLTIPSLTELRRSSHRGIAAPAEVVEAVRPGEAVSTEDLPREFFAFLTAESVIAVRVNTEALLHYVKAFDRVVEEFTSASSPVPEHGDGLDLQISVALLPEDQVLIEIQHSPSVLPQAVLASLRAELENLARPPCSDGPIAFTSRRLAWGGAAAEAADFTPPFSTIFEGGSESLEALLMGTAETTEPTRPGRASDRSLLGGRWRVPFQQVIGWLRQLWGQASRDRSSRGRAAAADAAKTHEDSRPPGLPDHIRWQLAGCTIEHVSRLIQRYPEHAELYGVRAAMYREEDRFDRVIQDCSQLIARRPEDANALLMRAEAHCLTGSREQGLRDVTTALQLSPQDPRALQLRGMIYLDLEAWTEADRDFAAAAALDVWNPTLQLHRARALLGREDTEQALQALNAALHADPHHAQARALRALVRRQGLGSPGDRQAALASVLDDLDAAVRVEAEHIGHRLQRAATRLACNDYEGVVQDCEQVLMLDPGNGQAHALRGIARQGQGDCEGAVEDCTEAIAQDVVTAEVHLARAAAFDELDQIEPAMHDCDTALQLDPDSAMACNARGLLHMKLQEVDEALADFERAIQLAPEWSLPLVNRGNAYRLRGDHRRAVSDYDRALQLDPDAAPIYLSRGMAYLYLERLSDARADLDAAIRLDPDLPAAYFSRSVVRLRDELHELALEDLNETIQRDPKFIPAYFNRANLLGFLERYEEALRDFDTLIALCPDLGIAYSGRGNLWIQQGEFERGEEDFRQAIACDPESSDSYLVQQLLVETSFHHRREEYLEAIVKAGEAIELDEVCIPAYAMRAVAYWYSEQLVEALEDFDWLMDHNADAFPTHLGRGQVLAEQGEFKAALADLNRAISLRIDDEPSVEIGYAYSGRGLVYAGLERYAEADRDFEAALQVCPENAWLHYNRGLRFEHAGDRQRALEAFQRALECSDPSLTPRKRARAAAYVRRCREDA